ncbi:DUF6233 domain-containing protein [Streptomyces sp. 35G-GA-8]|uniref:DUF6233 domain-containing protein n=1 Tax=Streptomyces sp. 35G-GA-8 TaxID=2939434 RepID=UPI00201EA84D|nr:DUF6233 domain-containing protein [Streptomyces sp. 35G-GA-8]MCL7377451.1 DUF6233 domain-containing protein [Streptomyces sp. 35G-GA-8]
MNESSRLEALRFLEKVQLQNLERTRRWIAVEEGRAAEAAVERPSPPLEWVVEQGIGARPVDTLHVGSCWVPGKRAQSITRQQAAAMFAGQGQACDVCRPDTSLGVLD